MKNKTLLYIKLITLNLLLVLVISTFVLTLNGRSLTTITAIFTSADLSNYSQVDTSVNLSTADISAIDIDVDSANIEICGYNQDGITIEYDDENTAQCLYIIENSTLKIKINSDIANQGDLDIFIPNGLLHSLSIETSSGDVKVYSSGSKLEVVSVSGEISLTDGYINNYIKTVSSNIYVYPEIDYIDSFNVSTVSGDCWILSDDVSCKTNFSSASGNCVDESTPDELAHEFAINYSSISGDLFIGQ
ncbi:MAG: hypothetical protein R3Y27_02215 [Clostridia bacterium]